MVFCCESALFLQNTVVFYLLIALRVMLFHKIRKQVTL